jgi:pyruvate/2-oxoglutarate dehydrogenase complex dihydrolipoamide acyltransferase (E2) component
VIEVRVPDHSWEEDVEGILSTWLYETGDRVQTGAVIAQIMVEKVQFDLAAPASGVLHIDVAQEQPIRKGDLVARISEMAE